MKKFEEGVFSDLRNLKPGVDASLEEPKVSFWYSFIFLLFRFRYRVMEGKQGRDQFHFFPWALYNPPTALVTRVES